MIVPCWRSLLFVPADNRERCAKAAGSGADAVILDLEDGVAPSAKETARHALKEATATLRNNGTAVVVRINTPWDLAIEDLRAALASGADALMIPKVQDTARLQILGEMAAQWSKGKVPGQIALVETPQGLAVIDAVAAMPDVIGLALGTEDFSLAMGVDPLPAVLELPSRQLALAAASRSLMALAVPLSIAIFRDIAAYEAAARLSVAHGVNGAICIHPAQVAAANRCFGATDEEIDRARRMLACWTAARKEGLAVTSLDGRMIDLPVAERARRLLMRSRAMPIEEG